MKFICHRGNIEEKNISEENSPEKILYCINEGYDIEIDVWSMDGNFYLGHDEPQYYIKKEFLICNNKNIWCHAKNLDALQDMLKLKKINCFWHEQDEYTLTSKGHIWVFPGKKIIKNCICVMPEISDYSLQDLKMCYGICSDKIKLYKKIIENNLRK